MNPYQRLIAIVFLLFMARGVTGPVSSLYVRSLGASYLVIGLLGTLSSVTAIAASYFWGRTSDRLGRRKIFLVIGLAVLALAAAAIALVPNYRFLFPLYIINAGAQSAYDVASLALIGDWLEVRKRRRAAESGGDRADAGRRMGTYRGLASLGFGLMAFNSGFIADKLSLRAPYGLAAGFMALGCLLAISVREPPAIEDEADAQAPPADTEESTSLPVAEQKSASPASVRAKVSLPLAPLLVAALLWSLVTGAVYAIWGNYMVEDIGYTPTQMTRLWSLASLSEFPLMILAGWLSDRVGRLPMMSLSFLAWTGVFTGYLVVPSMPWIMLVQLTRGFAFSAHTATTMTYAAEVRKRAERGRVSGLYSTAGALGSIMGSSVGGALTQFLGFRALIGVCAGVIFGGSIFLGVVALSHRARLRSVVPARLEEVPGA